ncbi:MAG: hypothetical protein FD165_1029 [Gammaproteobacteria bacterium]|nr:MAG: hypothetical protein FD165_1029 [Gammaproteobacteria bacterium]TND06263.1 MAG: hypothetical protein FD120_750 [Gammaproteobacteria bacterium]
MVRLQELVRYAGKLLDAASFVDYAPNGLQVEGRESVHTLITGVTASVALLEAAIDAGADAVLVHHGYFWRGEDVCITGMRRRRLQLLLSNNIGLIAYHLPLDAHPVYGNNAQLARVLGIDIVDGFGAAAGPAIARYGRLPEPVSAAAFAQRVADRLGRPPLHVAAGPEQIETIGFCTGAAQDYLEQAAALGLDAYLSGEISERTVHQARELAIHYFAAGHHATERYGVQALGDHLAATFGILHRHIDIDNPA